jgi:hypothetical protein
MTVVDRQRGWCGTSGDSQSEAMRVCVSADSLRMVGAGGCSGRDDLSFAAIYPDLLPC